jgi:hypothetical protein
MERLMRLVAGEITSASAAAAHVREKTRWRAFTAAKHSRQHQARHEVCFSEFQATYFFLFGSSQLIVTSQRLIRSPSPVPAKRVAACACLNVPYKLTLPCHPSLPKCGRSNSRDPHLPKSSRRRALLPPPTHPQSCHPTRQRTSHQPVSTLPAP